MLLWETPKEHTGLLKKLGSFCTTRIVSYISMHSYGSTWDRRGKWGFITFSNSEEARNAKVQR